MPDSQKHSNKTKKAEVVPKAGPTDNRGNKAMISDDEASALEKLLSFDFQGDFFNREVELWGGDKGERLSEMDIYNATVRTATRFHYHAQMALFRSSMEALWLAAQILPRDSLRDIGIDDDDKYGPHNSRITLKACRRILRDSEDFLSYPSAKLTKERATTILSTTLEPDELYKPEIFKGLEDKHFDHLELIIKEVDDDIKGCQKVKGLSKKQEAAVKKSQKQFLVALKLDELICLQLRDARNIAIRKEGKYEYPEEFKWKGKSSEESQKDLDARKPEVSKWLTLYLDMIEN